MYAITFIPPLYIISILKLNWTRIYLRCNKKIASLSYKKIPELSFKKILELSFKKILELSFKKIPELSYKKILLYKVR